MLDQDAGRALNEYAWDQIGCKIVLPEEWTDFFETTGRALGNEDDRRGYVRYYFRHQATLIDGKVLHCVYTANVSRSGIAFLHFEQLLPKQKYRLCLADGTILNIQTRRCRRVADRCYECGAGFMGEQPSDN